MTTPSPLPAFAANLSRAMHGVMRVASARWRRPPFRRRHGLVRGIAGALLLKLAGPLLPAQSPQPAASPDAYGFSYQLPPDWQMVPEKSILPAAQQSAEQAAKTPSQMLSVACAQVVLSARHGKPPSVIVVVALPFACYGQPMTTKNLPGFAAGVSDGLKQNFNIAEPVYGSYTLGTHNFWVERAVGVPKNHPQSDYTLEIACTALKKTAACWMTLANDATALRDFEHSLVTLDGEPARNLVPINAFVKKPL